MDFDIPKDRVKDQVMVVSSIDLENQEILSRENEEIIMDLNWDTMLWHKDYFYTKGVPDRMSDIDMPVCLLVPHMINQNYYRSICWEDIKILIDKLL